MRRPGLGDRHDELLSCREQMLNGGDSRTELLHNLRVPAFIPPRRQDKRHGASRSRRDEVRAEIALHSVRQTTVDAPRRFGVCTEKAHSALHIAKLPNRRGRPLETVSEQLPSLMCPREIEMIEDAGGARVRNRARRELRAEDPQHLGAACRASSRVAQRWFRINSSSGVAKKLSATALSQQFPFRLMLAVMPCASSTAR